jgi:hypothetical protein
MATMSTKINTTINKVSISGEAASPVCANAGMAKTNEKNEASALFIHLAFILENSITISVLNLQINFGGIWLIIKWQTFHFFYMLFIKKKTPD